MNNKKTTVIESIVTTVFTGLMIYSAYSLWYIFYGTESGADVHLYTVMTGCAVGWYLLLLVKEFFRKKPLLPGIAAFFVGNGFFQALIWLFNSEYNKTGNDNDLVIINTFSVTFSLCAVLAVTAFSLRAKRQYKLLNIILAVIFFGITLSGAVICNLDNIKASEYKKNIEFEKITAEEINLSADDTALCDEWLDTYFENGKYPFTFTVDGKEFDASQWTSEIESLSEDKYNGGKTQNIILTNNEYELEVRAEFTVFEKNATCQWTVYIRNTGKKNSPVISDFYALDAGFATGKSEIYYSKGSDTAASDFSLIKKKLSSKAREFSGVDGKPSEKYLPYFNVLGENLGVVLGIGWTGQWYSSVATDGNETSMKVKQESFNAYLLPGEEIRSPLVSLCFYDNDNALKGFNLFRSWITDCVYPENITQNQYTVMEVAGPVSTRTSDEIIKILDGLDKSVYEEADAFWMDAGWYSYNEGWYDGVGNWTVDSSRYDNGISELSSYAKEKGLGHVLWYEPERVYRDTVFYNEGTGHDGWLIDIGDENVMWNLADENAFAYYCEYILRSLQENGVTVYRQDFNFAPLEYWQKADAEYYDGRTGICENHYVTNLYAFLDYLCANIDGLMIDNCASGGKRLDLEMTYRSIPFWRSDYNCAYHYDLFEATQSHTYGISFWLPISGSALYMEDEYACRSDIMPLMLMDFFSHQHPEFSYNKEQRELMADKYYPLEFGSTDKNRMHAMQFSTDDAKAGTVLIYKREDVSSKKYTARLNGLNPEENYEIYDIDFPGNKYILSGQQLMDEGFTITLPEGRKAIILMFCAK